MDFLDERRPGQNQEVTTALDVLGVVAEARAAEVGLGKAVRLHHRPHRAVEHEHAAGEQLLEHAGRADVGGHQHRGDLQSRGGQSGGAALGRACCPGEGCSGPGRGASPA